MPTLFNKNQKRFINWENWPFAIIYAPLVFVWMYYAFKAKAFWFMSNVNPTLEFSGLEGETKQEMYLQLPKETYPETIYIKAGEDVNNVIKALANSGIQYPFIVKPEVGMQGLLFRKIDNEAMLLKYHLAMPFDYLIQQLVNLPIELSVFHIRYPSQPKGKITGLIMKEYLAVEGDGKSSLLTLISNHPKAKKRIEELQIKHWAKMNEVIAEGEKYVLSMAGNHNRGATFINLFHLIDEELCAVFDRISIFSKAFYYGRYDIKCSSLDDLKKGRNFSILEFNGVGAEPNHIYDCGMPYRKALIEIKNHWKDMFLIGKINHKNGHAYWGFYKGFIFLRNAKKFFRRMRQYDINIHVEK